MNFKEFLKNEIKDNGAYRINQDEVNKYSFSNYGYSKNKGINVETWRNWRSDNEVNDLLINLSAQLREKLTDSNFIKQNLYLINEAEYEHNSINNFFEYLPGNGKILDKAIINTSNIVGYVNKKFNGNNYSIVVSSRFGDDFLKHIISSTDGFLEISNSGDIATKGMAEWLLIFLWKVKLKSAFRLGLPKEYVSKAERIVTVRGNLNSNKLINNPDLIPPYDCQFREHSYDNSINQLITNTFMLIKNKSLINDCHKIRQDFSTATNGKKVSINELINYKPIKNPYYRDYNKVAELSAKIIRNEMADFANEKDDFSAFFFDMSMLFEYFIRKILIRKGFILEEKNIFQYSIPSGGRYNEGYRKLFPDIIMINTDNSINVYDVKYKHFDFTYGVSREDLFQLNTYVGQLSNNRTVKKCGFIFPLEESSVSTSKQIVQKLHIGGKIIDFEIIFFIVPKHGIENYTTEFNSSVEKFHEN